MRSEDERNVCVIDMKWMSEDKKIFVWLMWSEYKNLWLMQSEWVKRNICMFDGKWRYKKCVWLIQSE